MFTHYIKDAIHLLHAHPHWGGLFTFLVAFSESLAIIGSILPGSVTMTAIGVLIGSGVLPIGRTLLWGMSGALLGDYLSYWVGHHYQEHLRDMWPFKTRPHWLEKGETFFKRHGGKGIIIGRFFGPMRSMVPMIAGMLKMKRTRFLAAAIPSACGWAVLYMLPGMLVGALSTELPPKVATEFILVVLLIIAAMWVSFLLAQYIIKSCWPLIDNSCQRIWLWLEEPAWCRWIPHALHQTHPSLPINDRPHRQLVRLLGFSTCTALFSMLTISVVQHGALTHLNQPLWYMFQSFRTHTLKILALSVTQLGATKHLLIPMWLLMSLWFLYKKHWHIAAAALSAMVLNIGLAYFIKDITASPRPGGILHGLSNYSFPSGHVLGVTVLFGFTAMLITTLTPNHEQRKYPYIVAAFGVFVVSLSRLYLGAHWLTDIAGGVLLGAAIVFLVTLFLKRNPLSPFSIKTFSIFFATSLFLLWLGNLVVFAKTFPTAYALAWPNVEITTNNWWKNNDKTKLPTYRLNRLGHPIQPLNVQWLGSLAPLKSQLIRKGWVDHPTSPHLTSSLHRLASVNAPHQLPLLPQLYHNAPPALLMTKIINHKDKNQSMILRLWDSSAQFEHSNKTLWVGNISFITPMKHRLLLHRMPQPPVTNGATKQLIPELNASLRWHVHTYSNTPDTLQWNGKVLLIRDK